jgi:hypothetical protein
MSKDPEDKQTIDYIEYQEGQEELLSLSAGACL